MPHADTFAPVDAELITAGSGETPQKRWKHAEQLYRAAGLNAQFKRYPNAKHMFTTPMWDDVENMSREALAAH